MVRRGGKRRDALNEKDDGLTVSTMDTQPAESEDERAEVEILDPRVGGVGVRVIASENPPTTRAQKEAFKKGAKEVAALQDASTLPQLNLDLRGEYKRPNFDAAALYRRKHHPQGQNGGMMPFLGSSTGSYINWCGCSGSYDDVIPYGPGISNYFKWLKLLFIMYVVLFILQLPPLLFNIYAGNYFENVVLPLGVTSLGNLYRLSSNTTTTVNEVYQLRMPIFCDNVGNDYCDVDSGILLFYYACADALVVLVFLLFTCLGACFARRESKRFSIQVRKVEHYSLQVEHVPADATVEKLRAHFESLCETKLHEVHLVQTTGNAISLCVKRGRLIKKLARADARRKLYELINAKLSKREKAERNYEALYESVEDLDQQATSSAVEGASLFAFITFNTQRDRNKCLRMYQAFHCGWGQARHLRLDGVPLRVGDAPPPSTLLWENNEVSRASRLFRKTTTLVLLVILLSVTAMINYIAEPYKISKNVYDTASSGTTVSEICDGQFSDAKSLEDALAIAGNNTSYLVGGQEDLLSCLCASQIGPAVQFEEPVKDPFAIFVTGKCKNYLADRAKETAVQFAVSIATLLMNTVIFLALTETGVFMKFSSIVRREMTILRRLFVVTYINTGVLILIVNTDLEKLFRFTLEPGLAKDIFGLGSFTDFSPEWYRVVGTEVMIVALLNIIAPHAYPLFLSLVNFLYRQFHHPISQSELNEMFLGPDFVLSYRYSQVLMMTFFIMTYSAGLPILYGVGICSIGITYWVDKFFFTKVCRTPAQFSEDIAVWANKMLMYAGIVHLGVAIWMFSSPVTFPGAEYDNALGLADSLEIVSGIDLKNLTSGELGSFGDEFLLRLQRDSSIPGLVVITLIVLIKVLSYFSWFVAFTKVVIHYCYKVYNWIFSENLIDPLNDFALAENNLTFQQALDLGELHGIKSYNILANPAYARAFHLQEEISRDQSLLEVLQKRAVDSESGLTAAFSVDGDNYSSQSNEWTKSKSYSVL